MLRQQRKVKGASFIKKSGLTLDSRSAKHLEPLKGGKVPVEVLVKGKDADQNAKHLEKCLDVIKGAGVHSAIRRVYYETPDI